MSQRQNRSGSQVVTRRGFCGGMAVAASQFVVPRFSIGAGQPPGTKLNIAGIGLGVRGLGNLEKCRGANIVAVCDVDWSLAATAFEQYPKAAKYRDYREMLDKENSIDAVVVSTPDHTHAVIAADAIKRGKHVYVETPLAHDVWEVRQLARLAGESAVSTQMGNERHSGLGIRRAVEMLRGGGLGPVREVHCWTNRPQWPQGIERPATRLAPPKDLDWDLWLGPAPERSYDPAYHPYRWRGWCDFGTGALGAMGCHLLDVVHWGLELAEAPRFSIEADTQDANEETYPTASTLRFRFPARGDLPPVVVTWYDGGRQPRPPEQLPYLREIGSNGSLFVGDEHSMMFGPTVFGTNPGQVGPRLIPEFAQIEATRPFEKIPPVDQGDWVKGSRHIQEWIAACRAGKQPCASFRDSAPLAEMVLLGNLAIRSGQRIDWARGKGEVTNATEANRFLRRAPRKGWEI